MKIFKTSLLGHNSLGSISEVYPSSYKSILCSFATLQDNYPVDTNCQIYLSSEGRIWCYRSIEGTTSILAIVIYK